MNTWLLNKIGIPRKSFIGNNVLNTTKNFPMAKIGELQQYYIRAKETYEEHEFHQIKLITASGKEAYRSGWCIPILEHSEYKGMIVTLGDITEEVLLKQKLHEETIIMKAAMDSFDQVGWIILDKQKRIIKRNAVYRKKFKIPEEILNENDLRKNFAKVRVELNSNAPFLAAWMQMRKYEFLLIAPATSNTVSKIANSIGDTLLTNATIMSLKAFVPVYIAPTDYKEGITYTKLPNGKEMKLRVRKEEVAQVKKLERMENIFVLKGPQKIREVFKKWFGEA